MSRRRASASGSSSTPCSVGDETGLARASDLRSERDGGSAEPVTVQADNALRLDSALRDAEAATVDRQRGDLAGRVRATGCPRPAVIADVVGGTLFPRLLETLDPSGRYGVAGAIDGPLVETDLRTVYLEQLQLIGSSTATQKSSQPWWT